MWDVIVVGAGPAGAAAALAARLAEPAATVLLLDRARFPRDKSCGDGVGPRALEVLDGLGLGDVVDDYPAVHRLRLGYPGEDGEQVVGTTARPSRVVPRMVLDDRLVAAAIRRKVDFARAAVRRVAVGPDCVEVDGHWTGRVLIGADGAHSVVRRHLGLQRRPAAGHVALAIRGYAPLPPGKPHEQRIVFDRGGDWPAYAWCFSVGGGLANVGYGRVLREAPLSRAGLLDDLERLLPGVRATGSRWRAHHLPMSPGRARQPDGRVLLAGDAASLVNPLSGEGIYAAVESGAAAGRAAVGAGDPGAAYRADLARRLGSHLRHSSLAAVLARRPGRVDAILRAAARDPQVFDDLVELSMGAGTFTRRAVLTLLHLPRPVRGTPAGKPAATLPGLPPVRGWEEETGPRQGSPRP